jgi:hypothetical protein
MPSAGENTMNWSKLSKEKRNQLVLVVMITMAVLFGLGFGLVRFQYENLKHLAAAKSVAEIKLGQMKDSVKNLARLEAELAESKKGLVVLEENMATGDLLSWVIGTLRRFKAGYKVDLPQFSPIEGPTDMTLLPNFPYKQARLTVAGKAHFHDFGRFLADFENQFPHIRVLNLTLDLDPSSQDTETLAFKMEIAALVKPNQS